MGGAGDDIVARTNRPSRRSSLRHQNGILSGKRRSRGAPVMVQRRSGQTDHPAKPPLSGGDRNRGRHPPRHHQRCFGGRFCQSSLQHHRGRPTPHHRHREQWPEHFCPNSGQRPAAERTGFEHQHRRDHRHPDGLRELLRLGAGRKHYRNRQCRTEHPDKQLDGNHHQGNLDGAGGPQRF